MARFWEEFGRFLERFSFDFGKVVIYEGTILGGLGTCRGGFWRASGPCVGSFLLRLAFCYVMLLLPQ